MDDAGDPRFGRPTAVVAAERHRALRLAVEGTPLRQDLVALREEAGDLDRVLVRLAPTGREDRLREVAGRDLREKARERGAALLAERRSHVTDALGLLLDRTHDLGVPVSEVDVDQSGREIEDAALARVQP